MHILESRRWGNELRKKHFESGVRMGVGAFNLVGFEVIFRDSNFFFFSKIVLFIPFYPFFSDDFSVAHQSLETS